MTAAVQVIGRFLALIFLQRWYLSVLYCIGLLVMIGFSLLLAMIVSKMFSSGDTGGTRFVVNVVISFLFAASLAALWRVFVALMRKTAER
jgi:hypothetical protein